MQVRLGVHAKNPNPPSNFSLRREGICKETLTLASWTGICRDALSLKQSSLDPFEQQDQQQQDSIADDDDILVDIPATPVDGEIPASKEEEEEESEEEEENMDMELGNLAATPDPHKTTKTQAIVSQFTEEQLNRYEAFRRSGFKKKEIEELLKCINGEKTVPMTMRIVVSGIAKMFVGELIETGRIVMNERRETGPIRPCHICEAYRRLKLEGKIPKRAVPRLFR